MHSLNDISSSILFIVYEVGLPEVGGGARRMVESGEGPASDVGGTAHERNEGRIARRRNRKQAS